MPERYCRREKLFDFLQRHTFSIASVLGILVVIKIDLFGSAFLHCPMGMVEEKVSSRLVIGPGALLMCAVAPVLVVGAIRIYSKCDGDTLKRIGRGGTVYRFPLVICIPFPDE